MRAVLVFRSLGLFRGAGRRRWRRSLTEGALGLRRQGPLWPPRPRGERFRCRAARAGRRHEAGRGCEGSGPGGAGRGARGSRAGRGAVARSGRCRRGSGDGRAMRVLWVGTGGAAQARLSPQDER